MLTDIRPAVRVLLVEDNPGDVLLTEEALAACSLRTVLDVVGDAESALAYLRREEGYESSLRPDIVLLDLQLPGRAGSHVLVEVKGDEDLRSVPIVVLSSSRDTADVAGAYAEHANSYVTKPGSFSEYTRVVRAIEDFWFRTAELPRDVR